MKTAYSLTTQPHRAVLVQKLTSIQSRARARPEERASLGTVLLVANEIELQWARMMLAECFGDIGDLVSLGRLVDREGDGS